MSGEFVWNMATYDLRLVSSLTLTYRILLRLDREQVNLSAAAHHPSVDGKSLNICHYN